MVLLRLSNKRAFCVFNSVLGIHLSPITYPRPKLTCRKSPTADDFERFRIRITKLSVCAQCHQPLTTSNYLELDNPSVCIAYTEYST